MSTATTRQIATITKLLNHREHEDTGKTIRVGDTRFRTTADKITTISRAVASRMIDALLSAPEKAAPTAPAHPHFTKSAIHPSRSAWVVANGHPDWKAGDIVEVRTASGGTRRVQLQGQGNFGLTEGKKYATPTYWDFITPQDETPATPAVDETAVETVEETPAAIADTPAVEDTPEAEGIATLAEITHLKTRAADWSDQSLDGATARTEARHRAADLALTLPRWARTYLWATADGLNHLDEVLRADGHPSILAAEEETATPATRGPVTIGEAFPDEVEALRRAWRDHCAAPHSTIRSWTSGMQDLVVGLILIVDTRARQVLVQGPRDPRPGQRLVDVELGEVDDAPVTMRRTICSIYAGRDHDRGEDHYEEDDEIVRCRIDEIVHEIDETVGDITVNLDELAGAPVEPAWPLRG